MLWLKMRKIKKSTLWVLVALIVSVSAQENKKAPPTGGITATVILEKNLLATGGMEAHQRVQTLLARGDFGFTSVHWLGDYSFSYKAPSSDLLRTRIVSHGTSWIGRREGHRFRHFGPEGPGMLNGVGMEVVEQDWRSLVEWEPSREYDKVEVIGRAEVDKRPAYALRFVPKQGDPHVRFYDAETFLLVRMDQVQRFRENKNDPEVAYLVKSYFGEYSVRDGLRLPHVIAITRAEGDLLFTINTVQANAKIEDASFN